MRAMYAGDRLQEWSHIGEQGKLAHEEQAAGEHAEHHTGTLEQSEYREHIARAGSTRAGPHGGQGGPLPGQCHQGYRHKAEKSPSPADEGA